MGEPAFRYVAYGRCPKCGAEMIRPPEVTTAVCDCQSVVEVPLRPAILFRPSRLLGKLERLCPANVSLERFVNALMAAGLEVVEKMSSNDIREFFRSRRR